MLHALREFGRAIPHGEASLNLRRVFYRKKFRDISINSRTPDTRYHSQHAQDRFADKFLLHGKRDGIFVDIGAYDGVALSNTYYFERNWVGVAFASSPTLPHMGVSPKTARAWRSIAESERETMRWNSCSCRA